MTITTDERAVTSSKASSKSESQIKEIEIQVAGALSEMFRRAQADKRVLDRKPGLPPEGLVQDCEFGMILLLGRAWLRERDALPQNLKDEQAVREMIVGLIQKTTTALLSRRPSGDKGGEDAASPVFFSGAPYTKIFAKQASQTDYYSANLDSAMLVLGFLAPALQEYHTDLANAPVPKPPVPWIQNLSDLAVYVCRIGVEYAARCRAQSAGRFEGFSCDPNSVLNDDKTGPYLENSFDRLFFTWTASETARDLLEWVTNLHLIAGNTPPEELEALRKGIQNLHTSIGDASTWCESQFLSAFRSLSPPVSVKSIVDRVQQAPADTFDPEVDDQIAQVAAYVQNVYHLSQYAAIRSLSPSQVTLEEIADICDKLHTLVTDDILTSGLDAATQAILGGTLTRRYELGRNIRDPYEDDAYYPLVVRSISGLLRRTMDRLGERAAPADISRLVFDFRRVLGAHYKNMLARRPVDPGDAKFWSFAANKPYVLYATQRTIFASLEYGDFLAKMDEFEALATTDKVLEGRITKLLSEQLVENLLGPAIKEIVSMAKAQAGRSVEQDKVSLPLPKADWAAKVTRDWLDDLEKDFEESRLDLYLQGQAQILLERRAWANALEDPRTDKDLANSLKRTKEGFTKLMAKYGLSHLVEPTVADVLPQMFLELFDSARKSHRGKDHAETEYGKALKLAEGTKTLSDNPRIKVGKPQ